MVSLRHLVNDIRDVVRGGNVASSEVITDELIAFWIANTRALLIRQDLNKGRSISENIIQSLGCIDMEVVDASECCGIEIGCPIVRTKVQIPKPIEVKSKDVITRIGPIDITMPSFNYIPYFRAKHIGLNPYMRNVLHAFISERYVYVMGEKSIFLEKINVQGVFEDPMEVSKFRTCEDEPCFTEDSEYPISAWMIEPMKEMILKQNFRLAAYAPMDVKGEAAHKLEVTGEVKRNS